MSSSFMEWDQELLVFLNNLGSKPFDDFWLFSTQIESWTALFVYFVILIFYFYKDKKGWLVFLFFLITVFVTLNLTHFVKEAVERIRPNNDPSVSQLLRVLKQPTSFSFWSGHAASSFSIATFIFLSIRKFNKWIVLVYIWPFIFVASRIYVGAHYPSDILIGALVGIIIACVIRFLLAKVLIKM